MNWTKTPPTEPGLYLYRVEPNHYPVAFSLVGLVLSQNIESTKLYILTGAKLCELPSGGEWWPIPIEEPKP